MHTHTHAHIHNDVLGNNPMFIYNTAIYRAFEHSQSISHDTYHKPLILVVYISIFLIRRQKLMEII